MSRSGDRRQRHRPHPPRARAYYWCDAGYGCGALVADLDTGQVIDGAPIFRKLIGQQIERLAKRYRVELLKVVG